MAWEHASRDIVACETLNDRATSACASPLARRWRASCRWCGVSAVGRPNFTPRSLARFLPSPVRARISSRSNSAKPPRTVSISLPCGVVVSAQASFRLRKPALCSPTVAKTFNKSRVDRARRSRRVTISTSSGSSLRISLASSARSVFAPETFSLNTLGLCASFDQRPRSGLAGSRVDGCRLRHCNL